MTYEAELQHELSERERGETDRHRASAELLTHEPAAAIQGETFTHSAFLVIGYNQYK